MGLPQAGTGAPGALWLASPQPGPPPLPSLWPGIHSGPWAFSSLISQFRIHYPPNASMRTPTPGPAESLQGDASPFGVFTSPSQQHPPQAGSSWLDALTTPNLRVGLHRPWTTADPQQVGPGQQWAEPQQTQAQPCPARPQAVTLPVTRPAPRPHCPVPLPPKLQPPAKTQRRGGNKQSHIETFPCHHVRPTVLPEGRKRSAALKSSQKERSSATRCVPAKLQAGPTPGHPRPRLLQGPGLGQEAGWRLEGGGLSHPELLKRANGEVKIGNKNKMAPARPGCLCRKQGPSPASREGSAPGPSQRRNVPRP